MFFLFLNFRRSLPFFITGKPKATVDRRSFFFDEFPDEQNWERERILILCVRSTGFLLVKRISKCRLQRHGYFYLWRTRASRMRDLDRRLIVTNLISHQMVGFIAFGFLGFFKERESWTGDGKLGIWNYLHVSSFGWFICGKVSYRGPTRWWQLFYKILKSIS